MKHSPRTHPLIGAIGLGDAGLDAHDPRYRHAAGGPAPQMSIDFYRKTGVPPEFGGMQLRRLLRLAFDRIEELERKLKGTP